MADSYTLSLAAVDILAQTLGVNLRMFPLEIPSVGQYETDRRRIATAVFVDLVKRGLVRRGELDQDLTRALRALSDFQIAVAVMGTPEEGKQLFARASANADTGVLAVQEGQQLTLRLIRPTAVAMTMVGLLPKAEAGPGQSVTLAKPAPVGGRRDDEDGYSPMRRAQERVDPAMRIAEGYLTRPRTGSGFFSVTGRDRNGKEIQAGGVGWFDTDAGRYLSLTRPPSDDGQIYGTFSPADSARLTQQLGQLIQLVAPR
jgi:ESX secretion-associated protein EspG